MLLEAATEVFYQYGYNDATVDMIASTLGSTKAVFYYHYSDKQSVLNGIFDNAMSAAIQVVQDAIERGGPPHVKLAGIVRNYTSWVIANRTTVGVFWREVRSLSDESRVRLDVRRQELAGMIKSVIIEGMEKGDFEAEDAASAARMILGMTSFLYTWWRENKRFNSEETARQMSDAALRIVGAHHGRASAK